MMIWEVGGEIRRLPASVETFAIQVWYWHLVLKWLFNTFVNTKQLQEKNKETEFAYMLNSTCSIVWHPWQHYKHSNLALNSEIHVCGSFQSELTVWKFCNWLLNQMIDVFIGQNWSLNILLSHNVQVNVYAFYVYH